MRILVEVDDCKRECLALVADSSVSGVWVARELDRLLAQYGKPRMIVSDWNRTHLELPSCSGRTKVVWHYIALGKQAQNAIAEWFIGRLCDELPMRRYSARFRVGRMSSTTSAMQRRPAAPRSTDGSALRTAAITAQQGITERQIPIAAG
jgi:putative transposase